MVIFLQSKTICAPALRRCRLRHEIRTIKTRPNKPLRFLQRKNSIRRYLTNELTCVARKTTYRTRKRFHNKQYTSKSKDQPLESDRTHFDTGFNKSNVAMHHQTFFSSFSQNHNRSIKNNQPEQSIISNNHDKQSLQPFNNTQKTKHNKHEKPSHQLTTKSITQTTTTNNPHNLSIKNTPKTNTTSNYEKMQCF